MIILDYRYKRLDDALIAKYEALRRGEIPRGRSDLLDLAAINYAVHLVQFASDVGCGTPCECSANSHELCCNCKSFMGGGICSHVVACNHLMYGPDGPGPGEFDLRQACMCLEQRRKRGRPTNPKPALIREPRE